MISKLSSQQSILDQEVVIYLIQELNGVMTLLGLNGVMTFSGWNVDLSFRLFSVGNFSCIILQTKKKNLC